MNTADRDSPLRIYTRARAAYRSVGNVQLRLIGNKHRGGINDQRDGFGGGLIPFCGRYRVINIALLKCRAVDGGWARAENFDYSGAARPEIGVLRD